MKTHSEDSGKHAQDNALCPKSISELVPEIQGSKVERVRCVGWKLKLAQ